MVVPFLKTSHGLIKKSRPTTCKNLLENIFHDLLSAFLFYKLSVFIIIMLIWLISIYNIFWGEFIE